MVLGGLYLYRQHTELCRRLWFARFGTPVEQARKSAAQLKQEQEDKKAAEAKSSSSQPQPKMDLSDDQGDKEE